MSHHLRTTQIVANGAALHYVLRGEGEPVVFVHGSLNDYRSWTAQIGPFSERYRVVAYSRRYHWPNAWVGDGSDYSAGLQADDLAALITALGLEMPHIVGSSYGAYTALLFALQHPKKMRTLVLSEPPLHPLLASVPGGAALVETFDRNVYFPARCAFESSALEQGVRLFIEGVLGKPESFDRLPRSTRQMLLDNARVMQAEIASPRLLPAFTCTDAQHILSPTLLLTGERSPTIFRRITEELARCLPFSELVVIPRTSHAVHAGNARAYNEAVLDFLGRHGTF